MEITIYCAGGAGKRRSHYVPSHKMALDDFLKVFSHVCVFHLTKACGKLLSTGIKSFPDFSRGAYLEKRRSFAMGYGYADQLRSLHSHYNRRVGLWLKKWRVWPVSVRLGIPGDASEMTMQGDPWMQSQRDLSYRSRNRTVRGTLVSFYHWDWYSGAYGSILLW